MSRELAELPHSWSRMKLGHLAAVPINNGVGESAQDLGENFLRYIRITDIKSLDLLHEERAAGVPLSAGQTALLEREDLVLAAVGATVGTAHFFTGDYPACFAGYLVRFRADQTRCDPRYVAWWSQSTDYWSQIKSRVVRSTIENFSAGRYRMLDVPVPPVEGQRRIADYLDRETATTDALIEKQRDFLKVLSSRKQALVDEAVRFPFVLPLKRDTVLVTSGPRGWAQFYAGDGTRFIRITDIQRGSITLSDHSVRYVDAPDEGEARRASTRAGDLVVSITADLGSVGLVDEARAGAVVSQHVAIVRLAGRHWDPRFASYALKSSALKDQFAGAAYGGTKVQLSLGDVRDLQVPAPPLEQQREIADHLDRETAKIDALIAKAERFIELAQERRAALITAAVTGQIEIPTED